MPSITRDLTIDLADTRLQLYDTCRIPCRMYAVYLFSRPISLDFPYLGYNYRLDLRLIVIRLIIIASAEQVCHTASSTKIPDATRIWAADGITWGTY